MKINNKHHWDKFIYGLLYPGFIGSMIYELIPTDFVSIVTYFSIDNLIKILIVLYYSIDYLHLYGDMNEIVKIKHRDRWYLICDVLSSFLLFLSFVFVKLDNHCLALLLICLVPICILIYKRRNKADIKYFVPFCILSIAISVILLIIEYNDKANIYDDYYLLVFTATSLLAYIYYVFYYYDKNSLEIDKKNFN